MGTNTEAAADPEATEITVQKDGDWFVARDAETGVASQGKTRAEAVANLGEALELHAEPIPDDVEPEKPDVPWFDGS